MVRNKHNTLVIMKYPFRQMTAENPKAVYACINYGEAVCPKEMLIFDSDVSKEYLRFFESGCLSAEELDSIRQSGLTVRL